MGTQIKHPSPKIHVNNTKYRGNNSTYVQFRFALYCSRNAMCYRKIILVGDGMTLDVKKRGNCNEIETYVNIDEPKDVITTDFH